MMGVLKGAVFFVADLMRQVDVPCELDFMAVSSYGSLTDSSGVVRIIKDLDAPIEGRDVLIVEDVVDSGLTLGYLLRSLRSRNPRSLEVCALLVKPHQRKVELPIRYVGFEIPNRFVVGYGLDLDQRYRNLPYVAALEEQQERSGFEPFSGKSTAHRLTRNFRPLGQGAAKGKSNPIRSVTEGLFTREYALKPRATLSRGPGLGSRFAMPKISLPERDAS